MPKQTILLIEDHAMINRVVADYLDQLGHTVVRCASLDDALWAASATDFDVILCDLQLPDGNGCELAELVQSRKSRPILIAISALPEAEARAKSFAAGFDHFLGKPFLPEEIDELLNRVGGANLP